MQKYFPFLDWLKNYNKAQFSGDLSAGITVGVMLIPQGMAYSMLAGLPPIYGLYASTIPLIIYALLGTSRQLSVGPTAMVALLISSGVGALATSGSAEFISLALLLALMVGVIQFLMGVLRLGFLVNFLSHPVITGFTSAAAIIIAFSQIKHLLGLDIPRGKVHEIIINIIENINGVNIPTLVVGVSTVVILIIAKKINKKIPGPIIAVILGMFVVYFLRLDNDGVKIIKDVPSGLPSFGLPGINGEAMISLIPIALTISLLGFIESIAVGKAIQAKHKNYNIDANQELIGLGLANVFGAFFKSFPVTGGFSRTAVNDQAGAKTGLASIISAVLIIITLLFLTEYFYFLPNAVLGAIIIVAVYGLIDFKEAKHLWNYDKKDFLVFMVTAGATLILGIEEGILVGVVLSLGIIIYRVSYPHMAELGRVPGSDVYRNIQRFDNLEISDDILIVRFDAQLYFANASSFSEFVDKRLLARPMIKHVVFDFSSVSNIDSSAIHVIKDLVSELQSNGRDFYLSNVRGPVRDILYRYKIMHDENMNHFFLSNQDAIKSIKFQKENDFPGYVSQSRK